MISVIVPVRGETPPGEAFLARAAEGGAELVVAAEPGTPPETLRGFETAGARVLVRAGPRGARLAAAAREARGDVLLFLHADTLLPAGWMEAVERALTAGAVAGAFRLAFDGPDLRMAWVAFWANRRTAVTRVAYGDQAPFVRRDVYERVGGHEPWPLLEDVALGNRLKREGRIALLPLAVRTSPRRYLERGVLRTVLTNWRTLARYRRGVSAEALAEEYRK